MANFITLTIPGTPTPTPNTVLVNLDHILTVAPTTTGCVVTLSGGISQEFTNSFASVQTVLAPLSP